MPRIGPRSIRGLFVDGGERSVSGGPISTRSGRALAPAAASPEDPPMNRSLADRRPMPRVRLRLEPLEDRAVPAAGELDPSFGTAGRVSTDFSGSFEGARSVLIQSDHKIVVAGDVSNATTSFDFAVARYNPDGTPDLTFGTNGRVTTDFFGGVDFMGGAVLQPDGKIVVSGVVHTSTTSDLGMVRFNANGTLDTTFGTGGRGITDLFPNTENGGYLALMPDGRLVVAGYTGDGVTSYTAVARYNPDGSPDAEFGADGKTIAAFDGYPVAPNAVAVQRDGRVVVAGVILLGPGATDFGIARFRPDGTPDSSFGSAGRVVTDLGEAHEQFQGLALQPNGRIVAVGLAGGFSSATRTSLTVVRYLSNGSLDTG